MPKRILLADDSITIQKVVELTFSEGDYEVICVGNGAQAIRKAEESAPDIALVDVMMPQRNGYEVCAHIKQDPNLSWIPVLLLTGTFEPFDARRAESVKSDGHITKPFESRALVQQVEEMISAHPRPQAAETQRAPSPSAVAPEVPEAAGAGRTPAPEPETAAEVAVHPKEAEASPATVRIDSRAFFAQIAAAGDVLETPPSAPSLGPLDLAPEEEHHEEPTHPLRAAPSPAPPAPAVQEAAVPRPAAAPEISPEEVRRILIERIEAIVRPAVQEAVERVLQEVAWEIIPEAAESAIRRRIRELEEEAAGGPPPVQ